MRPKTVGAASMRPTWWRSFALAPPSWTGSKLSAKTRGTPRDHLAAIHDYRQYLQFTRLRQHPLHTVYLDGRQGLTVDAGRPSVLADLLPGPTQNVRACYPVIQSMEPPP